MSKIRINELARQLEVKSREVIEKLHELGIAEKVTHSSSIDDDMADKLRRYYEGDGSVRVRPPRTAAEIAEDGDHGWSPDDEDEYHPPVRAEAQVAEAAPDPTPAPQAPRPAEMEARAIELTAPKTSGAPPLIVPPTRSWKEPRLNVPAPAATPVEAGKPVAEAGKEKEAEGKEEDENKPRAIPLRPPLLGRGSPIQPPVGRPPSLPIGVPPAAGPRRRSQVHLRHPRRPRQRLPLPRRRDPPRRCVRRRNRANRKPGRVCRGRCRHVPPRRRDRRCSLHRVSLHQVTLRRPRPDVPCLRPRDRFRRHRRVLARFCPAPVNRCLRAPLRLLPDRRCLACIRRRRPLIRRLRRMRRPRIRPQRIRPQHRRHRPRRAVRCPVRRPPRSTPLRVFAPVCRSRRRRVPPGFRALRGPRVRPPAGRSPVSRSRVPLCLPVRIWWRN